MVAAYKAQLTRQRPVTVTIPVYDGWYRSNEVDARVASPCDSVTNNPPGGTQ
jgi:hypothetical protein